MNISQKKYANCEVLQNSDVVLRLDNFCIQKAAKRARDELVAILLNGIESEPCVETSVDLLGCFLETTDFGQLRSRHPELAGGTACLVRLHRCEDSTVHWEEICKSS